MNESDSYTCLIPDGRMLALAPRSSSGTFGGNFASCLLSSVVFSSWFEAMMRLCTGSALKAYRVELVVEAAHSTWHMALLQISARL